MGKTYTTKTPHRVILRSPLLKIYYYQNKWLQLKESQYLLPTYSFRCGFCKCNTFCTVINIVVVVHVFIAFVEGNGCSVAVVVSGGCNGSSVKCGWLYNRGRSFSRICLCFIRGRHGWIDGDETECFGRILLRLKMCGQATS